MWKILQRLVKKHRTRSNSLRSSQDSEPESILNDSETEDGEIEPELMKKKKKVTSFN